jgi:hypothetical protein
MCFSKSSSTPPPEVPAPTPEAPTMADTTVQKSRQIEIDKAKTARGTGATNLVMNNEADEEIGTGRAASLYGNTDRKKRKLGA